MSVDGDAITHHFTVDVEEYFQVSAFESQVSREQWDGLESRVRASVERLLRLLSEHGAGATFFILGWVAERHPDLVRDIDRAGHEVASHGWDHRRVTQQTRAGFRESVRRTKCLLEDLTGKPVLGFRAPTFSIIPGWEWALDTLIEEGHQYDSSLFPIWRPGYGYPRGERHPHWISRPGGQLFEIPPATLRVWGINLPTGGGAYFRLLPYGLFRATLRDHERRGVPATFYMHPWEIDDDQPRLSVPLFARLRHYGGLRSTPERLARLLGEFRFQSIAGSLKSL
jgi:polysaccharide deacetylase family protein (PEP-CTERM system associated)